MKLVNAFLLTTLLTTASAWHLQMYRDPNYIGIIEDRSGTLGQACKNLGPDNVVSSMHWKAGTLAGKIVLFDGKNCQGASWATDGDWNVAKFSSVWDNKISSYKIEH
ncbi:hypothetical protein PQX77_018187 [Marasmius sp. AFHP31]|nr:hypothetical protein PQX77_018187 [Marasmius sp. AFHP31]